MRLISRRMLATAALGLGLLAMAVPGVQAEKLKVVYHVSEPDKVPFTLGNMRNHIKGVGGPENVELVLVVHGPALKRFQQMEADERINALVASLQESGVAFNACGNTMRAMSLELDELVPGFVRRDEGGVVRIAELQSKGYIYIRP